MKRELWLLLSEWDNALSLFPFAILIFSFSFTKKNAKIKLNYNVFTIT